jgi:septal ring factor EnvC (AmiA/AmiB activator)
MKKSILLAFVLLSSLTFAQTRELQQSIDSFRTVLNQQNAHIKQLQSQVRKLNTIVSTIKNDLNAVPEFAKVDNQQLNTADSSLVVVKTNIRTRKILPKVVIENPQQFSKRINSLKVEELIRKSKLIRVSGNKTYYRDKQHRQFFVVKNGNKAMYIR